MRSLSLAVVLFSATAFAQWGQAIIALVQISGYSSTSSSQVAAQAERQKGGETRECDEQSDCHSSSRCYEGRCVTSAPQPIRRVSYDPTCAAGMICDAAPPSPAPAAPPAVPVQTCSADAECGPGRTCTSGQCLAAPPLTPSSSLRRRGSEIYIRERMVELREELALGRGPVINGLARTEGVRAQKLGTTLREHHTELVAMIGDGSDPQWPARFLTRVDELCGRS